MAQRLASSRRRGLQISSGILGIIKVTGATYFDASYHAVALKQRGIFVSADHDHVRKAAPLGHVMALKDWIAE